MHFGYIALKNTEVGGGDVTKSYVNALTAANLEAAKKYSNEKIENLELGTAAKRNAGVEPGDVPVLDSGGKIEKSLLPESEGVSENSGVTAGTYNKVTVNEKGIITAAENEDIATKEELDTHIGNIHKEIADYYNKQEINSLLEEKNDKDDAVLKTDLNDYYKKEEIDSIVEDISRGLSGNDVSKAYVDSVSASTLEDANKYSDEQIAYKTTGILEYVDNQIGDIGAFLDKINGTVV